MRKDTLQPHEVRPKGSDADIDKYLGGSHDLYRLLANPTLVLSEEVRAVTLRHALVNKAKGLILQNPRPEDLKRVK